MSIVIPTVKATPFSYSEILKKGLKKETPKTSIVRFVSISANKSNQRSRSSSKEDVEIYDKTSSMRHDFSDDYDTSFSTIKSSSNSSDSEINVVTLISSESDTSGKYTSDKYTSGHSKIESSDSDSPLLSYSASSMDVYNLEKDLYTEMCKKKKHVDETDFLNPNWKLPGGKKYQKDGVRLENAFYNGLPKRIKSNISVNVKPRYPNGNVIVEFDMIYQSDSSKRIISFEIKGVNPNTINNLERQRKLISQGIRQKKYLEENYSDYKVDTIYCFVTGKIKTSEIIEEPETNSEWKSVTVVRSKPILDPDFIKKIKNNGIGVAIGETPQQCAKNALLTLNLLR